MPNPVTIADIEARWKPLSDQQKTNAFAYIDDAWSLLLGRRPALEANLTEGTVSEGNVVRVISAMVLRILRNPEGKQSEQIDDYKYTRAELVGSGLLHITPDELADVTVAGKRGQRSVRMVAYGEY